MVAKILKFEFILLSMVATLNVVFLLLQDNFPDNIFLISSADQSFNPLYYFLSSLVYVVGHFSGAWVLEVFLIYLFFYAFIYSQRDSIFDLVNLFLLVGLMASVTFLFFPPLMGEGIKFLLKDLFPLWTVVLVGVICGIFFVSSSLGNSFKSGKKKFFAFCRNVTALMERFCYQLLGQWSFKRVKVDLANRLRREDEAKMLPATFTAARVEKKVVKKTFIKTSKVVKKKSNSFSYKEMILSVSVPQKDKKIVYPDDNYFDEIIDKIEQKLNEFRINGQIVNVLKGPVVDTFELELGPGVKVSRVTSISEDLSLALFGVPLRIVYPMRGKTTVGIEVPRNPREMIYLDDLLKSKDFERNSMLLPLVMGKNAFGKPCIVDLTSMPHMLVAGVTGAGKSVFINSLIISLLVKCSPEKLKLILIDPKQLELALYANLPHLLLPVVTDSKRAQIALLWACQEMEKRYTALRELGVRNLDGFNKKIKVTDEDKLARLRRYYPEVTRAFELPFIVVIVDEFADLVLTKTGKDIETNICRLAAKARAAGIHLVVATQRPSVDVITGLIKSNFPTRVSFRVTSNIDSRTILNSTGAEKLLGKGDMLYKHGVNLERVHAAFVEEREIEMLMEMMSQVGVDFNDDAERFMDEKIDECGSDGELFSSDSGDGQEDEYYQEAVKVVSEHGCASASMLQRRFRIGYNRAANLVEMMEIRGVVGKQQGSKPREILVSMEMSDQ